MDMPEIDVPLPMNTSAGDDLLGRGLSYPEPKIITRRYPRLYINQSGICFSRGRLLKSSLPPYDEYFREYQRIGWLSRLKRRTVRLPDGPPLLVVHNLWSTGYFHWMTEALVKLWHCRHLADEVRLLLPARNGLSTLMEQTADALGFDDRIEMPAQRNLSAKNVILVENTLKQAEYSVGAIRGLGALLRGEYANNSAAGSLIYLRRPNNTKRRVANDEEVERLLVDRGFSVVEFDKKTFPEQVAIMSAAKVVISIHGAGLSNVMFMREGGHVLEFYRSMDQAPTGNRLTPQGIPSYCYRRLAPICGLNYLIQFCPAEEEMTGVDEANLIVDLEQLLENLALINL